MTINEYNSCVDQHADNVYRFILKNLKDEDKARDVVQDAFEKMWMKVKTISFEKGKSYLFTTAYHTMIDHLRKDKKFSDVESEEFFAEQAEDPGFTDLKEVIDEAVNKLPDIQRSVLLLRDYEGYSYQEIGAITGLSESQVKVYIYRARMAMKKYIGKLENVL
jgi:RNA polymerase sigma-70 factor (ECF subfamily)